MISLGIVMSWLLMAVSENSYDPDESSCRGDLSGYRLISDDPLNRIFLEIDRAEQRIIMRFKAYVRHRDPKPTQVATADVRYVENASGDLVVGMNLQFFDPLGNFPSTELRRRVLQTARQEVGTKVEVISTRIHARDISGWDQFALVYNQQSLKRGLTDALARDVAESFGVSKSDIHEAYFNQNESNFPLSIYSGGILNIENFHSYHASLYIELK